MSDVVITVEHLSKKYRLGQIGVDSLREAVEAWWHRLRGRDPAEHMGEVGRGEGSVERGTLNVEREEKEGEGSVERGTLNVEREEREGEGSVERGTLNVESEERQGRESGEDPSAHSTLYVPRSTNSSRSDELWALRDVSFEVKRGEVLGIIGRNGAGKSTLLKILTRITEPTSGRAVMRGRVASLLEVGTGFHPELTGRENIFLNGAILGMKRREIAAKFDEIVAFAEVEKFIDTPVKRYSSGMYVRLAFAVAAHLEPEILLVDEVLAVGDASFQKKCLGKMGEVAREGRTVLFVSHNMGVVSDLCRACLLFNNGRVTAYSDTHSAISEYHRSDEVSDCIVDLSDLRRERIRDRCLDSSVFIWKKLVLRNSAGRETSNIELGEPFELSLECETTRRINCSIGISIGLPEGRQIAQLMTMWMGVEATEERNLLSLRCRVEPNLLVPGIYHLGLGVRGDKVSEYIPSAMIMRVLPIGDLSIDWKPTYKAIFVCPCRWITQTRTISGSAL